MYSFPILSPRGRPYGGAAIVNLQNGIRVKMMFNVKKRGPINRSKTVVEAVHKVLSG
jgi:hypothetical protein